LVRIRFRCPCRFQAVVGSGSLAGQYVDRVFLPRDL